MAKRTIIEDGLGCIGDVPPITLDKKTGMISAETALMLSNTLRDFVSAYNGGISLGSGITAHRAGNLDAQYVDVLTPGVANTEFVVPHGLGRIAIGYDVVRKDRAADVYDSSTGSWTDELMYLRCSVASATVRLRIY